MMSKLDLYPKLRKLKNTKTFRKLEYNMNTRLVGEATWHTLECNVAVWYIATSCEAIVCILKGFEILAHMRKERTIYIYLSRLDA